MLALLLITCSLPLACSWVFEGGELLLWLARVEEVQEGLRQGSLVLFPSLNVIQAYGGELTALDSNLLLMIPAVLRIVGAGITSSYRIYMLLLQAGTILFAWKFSQSMFRDDMSAVFGVIFYVTCPYRLYISYDQGSLGAAAVWMLLPLLALGIRGISHSRPKYLYILVSSLAFAGIVWSSASWTLILYCTIAITSILLRKIQLWIPFIIGSILSFPQTARLLGYLLRGGMEEWKVPADTISGHGYFPGQFFTAYVYKPGQPGLGMGIMLAMVILLWMVFTENKKIEKPFKAFTISGLVLLLLSLQIFPWDILQRTFAPILRAVALLGTPAIFFGAASAAFSISAGFAMDQIRGLENKKLSIAVQVIVGTAAVAVAVYMLNTLMYARVPVYLTDSLK